MDMTDAKSDEKRRQHDRREKAALEEEIKRRRQAVLVVNTHARQGEQLYGEAKQKIADAGVRLTSAHAVGDAERLVEIVKKTVAEGHCLVIVGGGDGTISSVVDDLAYADIVLGILPLGTANSFARTLAIPLDLAG